MFPVLISERTTVVPLYSTDWIITLKMISYKRYRSRGGSVGIATRYGLEGPGIESRWWRDFPHLSRPALKPTQPPVQWVPGHSRGKGGRGVVLTTHRHLVCRVSRKRVALYLYSPLEVFTACNRMEPSLYKSSSLAWTGFISVRIEKSAEIL
jgi:hypothetical protein